MPAVTVPTKPVASPIETLEGILEIGLEYMRIVFEDEENVIDNTGENAYEETELENEIAEEIDADLFIDNILVAEEAERPTIFLRYTANIVDYSDSFIINPSNEEEEEDTVPPEMSFDPEEIVDIAEGALGTGSPFARQTPNAVIAEIISGPVFDQIRPFEILTPWQSIGQQYVGNPFLTEDTFYSYAEVETPNTDELLEGMTDFVDLDLFTGYQLQQQQNNQDKIASATVAVFDDVSFDVLDTGVLENKIDAASLVQVKEVASFGFNNMFSFF